MAERLNGRGHDMFELSEDVTLANGNGEFVGSVVHELHPVVGNLAVIPETKIPNATFEFMVENGDITPDEVESASYDTGLVHVFWADPRVVEINTDMDTMWKPRGQVRPRLVDKLQTMFPTIISEWSDLERIERHVNNKNYVQPTDGNLAMAILTGVKPL